MPPDREDALIARAQEASLGVYPITPLYAPGATADRPGVAGLVIGYASLDARAILQGVQVLGKVLAALRRRGEVRR